METTINLYQKLWQASDDLRWMLMNIRTIY